MPNLGNILKQEINRLARRAVKPALAEMQKNIAELKHRIAEQHKLIQKLEADNSKLVADLNGRTGKSVIPTGEAAGKIQRLGPKLIRAQRKRLGLSQREFSQLLGVSINTLVLWESGKTTPREKVRSQFAAIREMGRRDVKKLLEQKPAAIAAEQSEPSAK